MTKILTSKGEELSMVLGEVLQPDKKCVPNMAPIGESTYCVNCIKPITEGADICQIPLDWPNAMKWRDWAVEKFGEYDFTEALMESYFTDHEEQVTDVSNGTAAKSLTRIIAKAQPEHYLKASARCVERKDK